MKRILRGFFFQFRRITILNRINFIDSKHSIPINIVFGDENFDFSFRKVFPRIRGITYKPIFKIEKLRLYVFPQIEGINE